MAAQHSAAIQHHTVRYTTILLTVCLVVSASAGALVPVTVRIVGRVATSSPPPVEIDGHLRLPAAFLKGCLGFSVAPATEPGNWQIAAYGRYLKVYQDSTRFKVDHTQMRGAHAALVLDGHVYVPVEMITQAFGIGCERRGDGDGFDLQPVGAAIEGVRAGSHDDYLRFVIDLSRPAPYQQSQAPGELVFEIPPPTPLPADWGCLQMYTFADPLNPKVTVKVTDSNWSRLSIACPTIGVPRVMTLNGPYRIVADLPRPQPLTPARAPEPDPTPTLPPPYATPWSLRRFTTARGAVRVFVMVARPSSIRPAMAGTTIRSHATVGKIAAAHAAEAAVNGGHFDACGAPLGMLVIDGEWIKHPMRNRCALGITETGKALIGRQRLSGVVNVEGLGEFPLGGLNASHWRADRPMAYTRRWGSAVERPKGYIRLAISAAGKVDRVEANGRPVKIPKGGYVVSAGGRVGAAFASVDPGTPASVSIGAVPRWPALRHAIGAGPQLVKNGKRNLTNAEELFRLSTARACSRTAVGIDKRGNLVIVAAEASIAGGLTLWELASVMWKLGCVDAMALDGGGSTTAYWNGRVINHPTDGSQRPVSNALLIYGVQPRD